MTFKPLARSVPAVLTELVPDCERPRLREEIMRFARISRHFQVFGGL